MRTTTVYIMFDLFSL